MGINATAGAMGDVASRIDVILRDANEPVPAEVKSYTEVQQINVKSIQQALENKLTMARQTNAAALDEVSTLAIGWQYPADRTGIDVMIKDAEHAYGISIGLVSVPALYAAAASHIAGLVAVKRTTFSRLRGIL